MDMRRQSGLSLVEVIIGVALITVILVVVSQLITLYLTSVEATQDSVVAEYQAESALETVRMIRDTDWATLAAAPLDTTLYVAYTSGSASLETTNPTPDLSYQTEVYIRSVYRDTTINELRSSSDAGTYIDTDARLVEVAVFKDGDQIAAQRTVLTNLFES